MYKTIVTLSIVLASTCIKANNALLQKLSCVNAEWVKQPEAERLAAHTLVTINVTYTGWIATHLRLVEQTLRARDLSNLSSSQKRNRVNLLNELHSYWQAGIFPVNDYLSYKSPVFIDLRGTHCAVGYLMMQSGHDELAQAIDRTEKFAFVHQIKTDGVKEWADEFGFTMDELAWIQPTYMPTTKFSELGDGPNGPVNKLLQHMYNELIFAGSFDSVNNLQCLNVGHYKNGQLNCLDGGVDGLITDLTERNGQVAVTGSLLSGGQTYPAAYFNGTWNYLAIPGRDGAIGQCSNSGFGNYELELAISHPTLPGVQEIWLNSVNNAWQQKAVIHGIVKDINTDDRYEAYAGAFDSITVYNPNDTLTIKAHNFILKDRYSNQWITAGNEVSDTILVAKVIGNTVYLGGVCSDGLGRSNICLTRYSNAVLQPLVFYYGYFPNYNNHHEITALEEYENNLLVGGEFKYDGSTACKSLLLLDALSGYGTSFAYLDSNVKALAAFDGEMYLAGNFSKWGYQRPLHYLGKVGLATSVNNLCGSIALQLYPNPTQTEITFTLVDEEKTLQVAVTDLTGREIIRQSDDGASNVIPVADLPQGLYILKVLTQNGIGSARFVKN